MVILEQRGKYQVVVFGEREAGRFVTVLAAGSVPIAFVDHDKRTSSALRMLSPRMTTVVSIKKFDEYTEKFCKEHGGVYNWTEGYAEDYAPPIDWIASLTTWERTLNQAISEACAAALGFSEELSYHARNS